MKLKKILSYTAVIGTLVYACIITFLVLNVAPTKRASETAQKGEYQMEIRIRTASAQGSSVLIEWSRPIVRMQEDKPFIVEERNTKSFPFNCKMHQLDDARLKIIDAAANDFLGTRPAYVFISAPESNKEGETPLLVFVFTELEPESFFVRQRNGRYDLLLGQLPRRLMEKSERRIMFEQIVAKFSPDREPAYEELAAYSEMPSITGLICGLKIPNKTKIVAKMISAAGGNEEITRRILEFYDAGSDATTVRDASKNLLNELLALPFRPSQPLKRFMLRTLDQRVFSEISDENKRRFVISMQTCADKSDIGYLLRIVREAETIEVLAAYYLIKSIHGEPFELSFNGGVDISAIKKECAAIKETDNKEK